MKLNINDFLHIINIKNENLSNNISEILFILNNCEVIGKPHQIIREQNMKDLIKKPIEFYLYNYFEVEEKIKTQIDNFEAILLKDVRVRNNFGETYNLAELLINIETINIFVLLNDKDKKPF